MAERKRLNTKKQNLTSGKSKRADTPRSGFAPVVNFASQNMRSPQQLGSPWPINGEEEFPIPPKVEVKLVPPRVFRTFYPGPCISVDCLAVATVQGRMPWVKIANIKVLQSYFVGLGIPDGFCKSGLALIGFYSEDGRKQFLSFCEDELGKIKSIGIHLYNSLDFIPNAF